MKTFHFFALLFSTIFLSTGAFGQKNTSKSINAGVVEKPSATAAIRQDTLSKEDPYSENKLEKLAFQQMKSGSIEIAIQSYKKVLEINPRNSRAMYNIAWMYATNKQPLKAIQYSKDVLRSQNIADKGEFYRMIANSYTEMDSLEAAKPYYEKSLALNSDDAMTIYNYGYNRFKKHDFKASISLLQKALNYKDDLKKNFKDFGDIYFYIGTAYSEINDPKNAIAYLDSALSIKPFENYFANKAQVYDRMKDYNKAIAICEEGLKSNPNSGTLYFKLYQIKKSLNKIEESEKDLRKAYALNQEDASILMDMGVLLQHNNQTEEALALYRKALKNGGESSSKIFSNMANIYSNNKLTTDSAVYYYKKAIELDKNSFELYYNYGNLLKDSKKYTEAEKQYAIANELEPNHSSVMGNYALILMIQEKNQEAKRLLYQAIKHHPNDFEINLILAEILFSKDKNYKEAEYYASKAIANLVPGKPKTTALSIRANSRMLTQQYRNAIDDYLELVGTFSKSDFAKNYDVLSNIGYCYLDLQEYSNAEHYFKQCLEYHDEIDALLGLSIVKFKQNDSKELANYKKKTLKVNSKLKDIKSGLRALKEEGYTYTPEVENLLLEIFKK